MIVRERSASFVLIEQQKHGVLARKVFEEVCGKLLEDDSYKASVLQAIVSHDDGWAYVDQMPFWNDEKHMPYHFLDFPSLSKIPFYHYGIEHVAKVDAYAGALCSAHYARFMSNRSEGAAVNFVAEEILRQREIIAAYPKANFQEHFAMLRFADNLSLFLCLNEPKVKRENVHFFFKKGIAVPEELQKDLPEFIEFDWQDQLHLKGFKQSHKFKVSLPYREIKKSALTEKSLVKAYETTEEKQATIEIKLV